MFRIISIVILFIVSLSFGPKGQVTASVENGDGTSILSKHNNWFEFSSVDGAIYRQVDGTDQAKSKIRAKGLPPIAFIVSECCFSVRGRLEFPDEKELSIYVMGKKWLVKSATQLRGPPATIC